MLRLFMPGYRSGLLLVIAISLLLAVSYCPLLPLYFDDNDVFKYISRMMLQGSAPYLDVIDNKPPLIYIFNLSYAIAGEWGFWIFDASLVLAVSIMFYRLNVQYKLAFPYILPILFNFIIRNYYISFGLGATREYTTVFLLAGFYILLGKYKYKPYLYGIIMALILFMQQEQVLLFIPLFLYGLFSGDHKGKPFLFRYLAASALGFLTIAAPIIIYLAIKHAVPAFWNNAFRINFEYYINNPQKPGLLRKLVVFTEMIHTSRMDAVVIFACVLGVAGLVLGNSKKYLLLITVLLVPLSFISEFISSANSIGFAKATYYLLPIAATLPMLYFVVFAFTKSSRLNNRLTMIIAGVLMLFGIALFHTRYVLNYNRYKTGRELVQKKVELQWLKERKPGTYDLYVVNNSNIVYFYNELGLKLPGKYLCHYFWSWYGNWDPGSKKLQGIIDDLELHHTKYIYYEPFDASQVPLENISYWENYLHSHFRKTGDVQLWQRI